MKKRMILIMTLCLIFITSAFGEASYQAENGEAFGELLTSLVNAYEIPSEENNARIQENLAVIEASSTGDYELAVSIADHWEKVYLDAEYQLNLYPEGTDPADLDLPQGKNHAFVVLGFELQDGEMTEELKGRCAAAAAAAKAYPEAILVCSGGATGQNNPENHTEAGLMKGYLSDVCGIDPARIFTDERAMTTAENAVNTLAILREQNVETMTIVTSAYHQRWGQVLYNALSAVYRQQVGYSVEIIGNYCFDIDTDVEMFKKDDRIAIRQLAQILGIPSETVNIKPEQRP